MEVNLNPLFFNATLAPDVLWEEGGGNKREASSHRMAWQPPVGT